MLKQCITLWNTGPYLQGNTDPLERWSFCAKLTAGTLADGGNTGTSGTLDQQAERFLYIQEQERDENRLINVVHAQCAQ